jgi:hypothetical protein
MYNTAGIAEKEQKCLSAVRQRSADGVWGVAKSRVCEISDMGDQVGEVTFKELATIPGIDKEFDRTP